MRKGSRGAEVVKLIKLGYTPEEINVMPPHERRRKAGVDRKHNQLEKKTGWHPVWGWLEPDEQDELNARGDLKRPTMAERESGYLMDEEYFLNRQSRRT